MPKLWLFCTIWDYRVTLWIKIFTKDTSFPPATLGRRKTWFWGSLGGPWGWSNQILWNQSFQMTSNSPSGGQSLEKSASEGGVLDLCAASTACLCTNDDVLMHLYAALHNAARQPSKCPNDDALMHPTAPRTARCPVWCGVRCPTWGEVRWYKVRLGWVRLGLAQHNGFLAISMDYIVEHLTSILNYLYSMWW